jgi:hypothetical protein
MRMTAFVRSSLIVLRVARSSTNRYEGGGSTNENRRPLQVDELKSVIDVTRKPHCIRLRREEGDTLKPELTVVL